MPIDPSTLALFALVSLALNLTPGPDMLYAVGRRLSLGASAGYAAAMGNFLGTLVHTAAAALGLAALLAASAEAFTVVRWIGAGVLILLGLRALLSRDAAPTARDDRPAVSLWRVVGESFAIHTLNPKTAVFFLAFLPQFVDPTLAPPTPQIVLLGLWFAVQAALVLCLVTALGGFVSTRLINAPRITDALRRAIGGVLVLLGLRLALSASR